MALVSFMICRDLCLVRPVYVALSGPHDTSAVEQVNAEDCGGRHVMRSVRACIKLRWRLWLAMRFDHDVFVPMMLELRRLLRIPRHPTRLKYFIDTLALV
jgi:hypothetical protein